MLVSYTINGGGTVAAARAIMRDYRPPKKKDTAPPIPNVHIDEIDQAEIPPEGLSPDLPPNMAVDTAPMETPHRTEVAPAKKAVASGPGRPPLERREIDHKVVDLNDVFNEVYGYMTALEKHIRENPEAEQAKIDGYKKEAALDIIALVQKRFDD
jgi:hypothetical protein